MIFKWETIWGNQSPILNKEISKAVKKRNVLRNKCLKHKTVKSRETFIKQRNH